ncbi:MAG: BrnT family toxin [Chloroflexi bacterium]|nr:BrnT family toxin [Chloroflexota bacterium]
MRSAWDLRKSADNLRIRGLDFELAALVFEGPTLERDDQRRDDGEARVIAIGLAQGLAVTVVYTDRTEPGGMVRRIISARLSNRRERQAYFEALAQE